MSEEVPVFEIAKYTQRGRMAAVVDGRPVVYAAVSTLGFIEALCPACASFRARSAIVDTLSLTGAPLAGIPQCHGCGEPLVFG